jgi:HAMP domain-containing protein
MLPLLFILAGIGGLAVYNDNNVENQLLFNRFNSYRALLEGGDLSFGTIQDKSKLETLLNEKVALAEILRSDYSVIYTSENSAAPLITAQEKIEVDDAFRGTETIKKVTNNGQPFISIITPLAVNGKVVAVLHQVLSNVEASNRVNQYVLYLLLIMFSGLAICYIAIFLLLNRVVLKNIRKLKQATTEIQKGNLNEEIKIDAKDEIGNLAEAFNKMTGELKKSKQVLEDYNKKLEAEVKERTKDLEITEQKLKSVNFDLEDKVKTRTAELEKLKSGLEETVVQRTADLNQKVTEVEKINKFMVDRELKMVELKRRISELEEKSGQQPEA